MKKLILSVCMIVALGMAGTVRAESVVSKVALWPANRVLDALDVFSLSLGMGLGVRAELMATELCKGGIGSDTLAGLVKDYDRQYGIGGRNGWYWSFITVQQEKLERLSFLGSVKGYNIEYIGVPDVNDPIYDFYSGSRDYWRIGGALGLLVEGELYLHPVEFADFIIGIFFIDLRGDDLNGDDYY